MSPLVGAPGFLDAYGTALRVGVLPRPRDPLEVPLAGGAAGLIAIDFATRRRMRVNGTIEASGPYGFALAVDQAYGNCPQYIQQRRVEHGHEDAGGADAVPEAGVVRGPGAREDRLTEEQAALIGRADTFFLGTAHPERGSDASHRGGPAGFVRVDDDGGLWWPDYPGNNMFNSLGNLAVDPTAAMLFVDFATGDTVQLTGTAAVDWTRSGVPGDDGGTGRRVRFMPRATLSGRVDLWAAEVAPYRLNPPLTA